MEERKGGGGVAWEIRRTDWDYRLMHDLFLMGLCSVWNWVWVKWIESPRRILAEQEKAGVILSLLSHQTRSWGMSGL